MYKVDKNLNFNYENNNYNDNIDISQNNESSIIRKFIKIVMKKKKIKLKNLCKDICSESYLSEFLNNDKSIGKFEVDLILQRLLISTEDFENYIPSKDYDNYMTCYKIVNLIEKKEYKKAEKEIEEYENTIGKKDKLQQRFILIMKSRIMQIKKENHKLVYKTLLEAVRKTIPEFEHESINYLIFGYDEVLTMIECMKFREKVYNDSKSQEFYNEMLKYIDKNNFDSIIKAKLYPKLVCLVAEKHLINKKYEFLLKKCNQAIKYLQKSFRLYFIEGILKYKSLALEGIIASYEDVINMTENDIKKYNKLKEEFLENEKLSNFISELFRVNNLSSELLEWYPSNYNRELYSLGMIIKIRREMLGMTQEKFSYGICDVTTLSKLERGITIPHPKKAKKLLARAGLFGEFQMFIFDCCNYEAYELQMQLSNLLNLTKFEQAYETLQKFKGKINLSSRVNKQYLGHVETAILNNLNSALIAISDEEAIKRYKKALEVTIKEEYIFSDKIKYFTKRELLLIFNIILTYEKSEDYRNAMKWLLVLESYYNNLGFDLSNYITTYELFMRLYVELLGDIGNFEKSTKISEEAIYQLLRCGKGRFIGAFIYCTAWNIKKRIENERKMQVHEIDLYKNTLEKSLTMTCIMDISEEYKIIKSVLKNL